MKFQTGQKRPPNSGRPKGGKNKTTSLKHLLQDALDRNKETVEKKLDAMFNNKYDLKWFLQLKASLEPREVEHSGEIEIKKIQIEFVGKK